MKEIQKPHIEFKSGIPIDIPNSVYSNSTDYFISYNDRDRRIYGDVTTAIVKGNHEAFYILLGDHRKEYFQRDTFEKCLEYFNNNPNLISRYSDIPEVSQ